MRKLLSILAALAATAIPALPSGAQTAQPQYVDAATVPPTAAPARSVVASNRRGTVVLTGAYAEQASRGAALIIPGKDMTGEQIAALTEDIHVMCRILNKKLAPTSRSPRWNLYYHLLRRSDADRLPFLTGPSPATRSIYVDGYGLLFLLTVDYPLSAPPQESAPREGAEQTKDRLWEQVRADIYAPGDRARDRTDQATPEYDPEMVARLTDNAIKSLRHVSNIRGLDPAAFVTLIIRSHEAYPTLRVTSRTARSSAGSRGSSRTSRMSTVAQTAPATTLVLRARKRDVDAFAAGETDYRAFRQKVELTRY